MKTTMHRANFSLSLAVLLLMAVLPTKITAQFGPEGFLQQGVCLPQELSFANGTHKEEYRVGVLAIRGFEAAYNEFNNTFSKYLTATAGTRFDKPIAFKLVPLNFISLFGDVQLAVDSQGQEGVDFIYVNPSAFSCIESEFGANTLVSQISRRVVGGQEYHLTKFGGVIFARKDNDAVNEIEDLRDKVIATASISGLGSGQMQFRLLQQRGLSYIQDPKQLVFTSNQGKVVHGVLGGNFDVGFVRTDQLERTKHKNGTLIDKSQLKIINGFYPDLEGEQFPFESSTILYPEWNLASLSHVANDVALAVQDAMLAIRDHAAVGAEIDACYVDRNCTTNVICQQSCIDQVQLSVVDDATNDLFQRCDTTPALASLALAAKKSGKYAGWRSTLSYMELRNMQEETNFIRKNSETGINACIRSARIVDAVVCPPGHFRKSDDQVLNGCTDAGLDCGDFQCLCKPCEEAFDVDVAPINAINVVEGNGLGTACPKFAICGQVSQADSLVFRAIDNKEREDAEVKVRVYRDNGKEYLEVKKSHDFNFTYYFEFDAFETKLGTVIFEVFVNEEQIPESPFRLEVTERQCAQETGDAYMEADDLGNCVCQSGSHDFGGKCVPNSVLIPSTVIPLVLIVAVLVYLYVEHKKKQGDSVWSVKEEELTFSDPVQILGRGTFGLVLLAEYRGTQVAVKRVIPPKLRSNKKGSMNWRTTLLGEGAVESTDGQKTNTSTRAPQKSQIGLSSVDTFKSVPTNGGKSSELFDFDDKLDEEKADASVELTLGLESGGFQKVLDKTNPTRGVERHHSSGALDLFNVAKAARASLKKMNSLTDVFLAGDDDNNEQLKRRPKVPRSNSETDLMADSSRFRIDEFEDEETGLNRKLPPSRRTSGIDAEEFNRLCQLEEERDVKGKAHESTEMSSAHLSGSGMMSSGGGKKTTFTKKYNLKEQIFGPGDEYARLKKDFMDEMRHLSKLRHPCITTVMGAVISKKSEPMLIMEYMDHGSLSDLLKNASMIMDGDILLPILKDIAQGVRFLHAATPQVIHGDLKAANVLVDSKFRAKVADFGLSQKKKVGATGTPLWMAPELLRGDSENTSMSDVYSFGIILYEMYSRKDPYEGENHLQVLKEVADPKINRRPPVPNTCPPKVAGIMTDCLVGSPFKRPSFEELDLRLKRLDVENAEPGQQIFSMQRKKQEQKAQRNEELLFDVFPRHVAEALRDGRKVEPETFDAVTIYFSDIVSYTTISSTLKPEKVSDMLDRLYLKFDAIMEKHDVFKIDTIGDAYMAITNLHKGQDDHAARMARFSMDTIRAAEETLIDLDDPSKGYVKIRVGFHSGPIVANVVGSRNPKYTLFGDTCNTASRMESNSLPGLIQCSDTSAELVMAQDTNVPIVSRGQIEVKGKGKMTTYWIDRLPSTPPAAAPGDSTDPPKTKVATKTKPRSKSPKRSNSPKRSKSPKRALSPKRSKAPMPLAPEQAKPLHGEQEVEC